MYKRPYVMRCLLFPCWRHLTGLKPSSCLKHKQVTKKWSSIKQCLISGTWMVVINLYITLSQLVNEKVYSIFVKHDNPPGNISIFNLSSKTAINHQVKSKLEVFSKSLHLFWHVWLHYWANEFVKRVKQCVKHSAKCSNYY